jgi:endonuclease/exonuclease/phosphatase family metal-dependent hydrolase
MDYQNLDKETAEGLKELQNRIDAHNLPSSSLDETIKIASWNIREFGKKPRKKKSLYYIAEILRQFDVIGVVELRENVEDMSKVLDILGPSWRIIYSDYIEDGGGNRERVGYVYDTRACTFTGLAGNANEPRKKSGVQYLPESSWWRKPFMASFRSGRFDFVALTTHIRWGKAEADRTKELAMLADYVEERTVKDTTIDHDVIVMGDFNIPSKDSLLYKAVTKRGLQMPAALAGITGSNLAKDKRYDQILHNPKYTTSFTNKGCVLDFYGKGWGALFPEAKNQKDPKYTFELSDHLPLWMLVNVATDQEQLDEVLAK